MISRPNTFIFVACHLTIKRVTNLLCSLKGDLVGGTSAAMASLFDSESAIIRGCCFLNTSTLFPAKNIIIVIIHVLASFFPSSQHSYRTEQRVELPLQKQIPDLSLNVHSSHPRDAH